MLITNEHRHGRCLQDNRTRHISHRHFPIPDILTPGENRSRTLPVSYPPRPPGSGPHEPTLNPVVSMSTVDPNAEWRQNCDKWRSPGARQPDVHLMTVTKKDGEYYAVLADGWDAPSKRHKDWVPTGKAIREEAEMAARELAAKRAVARGLQPDGTPTDDPAKRARLARKAKTELSFDEVLDRIEEDQTAGGNERTNQNVTDSCRHLRMLPAERRLLPCCRITGKELDKHVRRPIVENPDLTCETKSHYLSQIRSRAATMRDEYGLDGECLKALATPSDMTGKEADEYPFLPEDITVMENKLCKEETKRLLGNWAEAVEGLHYLGTASGLQPADVVYRKWTDLDASWQYIGGYRFKTTNKFAFAISSRFQGWLRRRKAKGGVWTEGYIWPEFAHGIRKCLAAKRPLRLLTSKQEEDRLTNVTDRLRVGFTKFLKTVCEIDRPGISYKSYRHYVLPFLRSQNVPHEVGMDMAGQISMEAFLGYGDHGTPQQYKHTAALLENHFLKLKAGKNEPIILTPRDIVAYIDKSIRKQTKTLVQVLHESVLTLTREIRNSEATQLDHHKVTHSKLDELKELFQKSKLFEHRRVVGNGVLLTFARILGLNCRVYTEPPDAPESLHTPEEIQNPS